MSSKKLQWRRNESRPWASGSVQEAGRIKIDPRENIHCVAFLVDGKYLISTGSGGTLRRWQVEDGKEVGMPMVAGSPIGSFAVSQDGKWIASGSFNGLVTLWNVASHGKVWEIQGHKEWVNAVDMSSDGSKIASGGGDGNVFVWSTSTRWRLLGPLEHKNTVVGAKFSPGDGRLIATIAKRSTPGAVQLYDGHDGHLIVEFPITVRTGSNQSLVWASDGRRLFLSSNQKEIHCLDAFAATTLWKLTHSLDPWCISLASNDTVLAISGGTSVAFWDIRTLQNIGPAVECDHSVQCMAISPHLYIATGGGSTITLQDLRDILPSPYCDDALDRRTRRLEIERANLQEKVQSVLAQDAHSNDKVAHLEQSVQDLRKELSMSQKEASKKENSLNETITDLEKTVRQLRSELTISQRQADERKDSIRSLRADLHSRETDSVILEKTTQGLRDSLSAAQRDADGQNEIIESLRNDLDAKEVVLVNLHDNLATAQHAAYRMEYSLIQIIRCEELYTCGSIYAATESLVKFTDAITDDPKVKKLVVGWRTQFTEQCVSRLCMMGDKASSTHDNDEALKAYSTALSLTPSPSSAVLIGWTRKMLIRRSPGEVFDVATEFTLPRFRVHRAICDVLEADNRVTEATDFFQGMIGMPLGNMESQLEGTQWESNFRERCIEKLKKLGDKVMETNNYDGAIEYYSIALSLSPIEPCDIIVKCCEARAGFLEDEHVDAVKIIETDPSSYKGYKRKYTALHRIGRYSEAFEAFERMLSAIESSVDPEIRKLRSRFVNTTPLIRRAIDETINDIPRVLVEVDSGRLFDRSLQVAAFEALPVYDKLRSSMTTPDRLDYARIRSEVEKFYEYVMFSHKWEPPQEPTLQMLENKSIDDLPESRGNNKLRGFREIVRSRQFRWCWSDTCCVNQADKGVQQESVVAMFRWYRRSAVTIVHLLGVQSDTEDDDLLWRSIWNTRGWTYQEYVASPVVQFYTEDWKPYRGLTMWNHKDSPIIRAEMERATKVATTELITLKPGLEKVREKLYLASRRETTRGEDVAYCLFGIFGISISVIYGEGKEAAVHRLLQHILTHSDNVTLLSWTGNSSSGNNSYLPPDLTVYDNMIPPHAPQPIERNDMDHMVKALRSSVDVTSAVELYEQLYGLPTLSLVAGRLKLPGLAFPFTNLSRLPEPELDTGLSVYLAKTPILGEIRIRTKDDLLGIRRFVLIHPWIGPLLDEDFSGDDPLFDLDTRALRLVVRLRQPFGGLLLSPLGRVQYKRVATDSLIQVQIRAETPLKALMDSIRIVDLQ